MNITPVMYMDPNGKSALLAALIAFAVANPVAALVIIAAVIVASYLAVKATEATVEYIKELKSKNKYTVYMLQDEKGNVMYIGRTKNEKSRESWHLLTRPAGTKFIPIEKGLDYEAARGLEQYYMAKYNTLHRGTVGTNQIRGISPMNNRIDDYIRAANKILGDRVENWVLDIFGL